MKLVKISSELYVAAKDISELSVNSHANGITVRMKNGLGHHVSADYGEGIYATLDRLVAEINKAGDAD